jgi:hypothetical protein
VLTVTPVLPQSAMLPSLPRPEATALNRVPGATSDPAAAVTPSATSAGTTQPTPPTADASAAEPSSSIPPGIQRRFDERMREVDPGGMGLTREQLAEHFPRLADHFNQLDVDHDGRATAAELMAAWPQIVAGQR